MAFGRSGKRREFIHSRMSRVKRMLCWTLPGLIATICLPISTKDGSDNPMIFAFDLSVLPDAQSAQKQPQGLTDWEERDVEPVSVQTEKASDTRLLTGLAPKGWQVSENIERYTGDNLYEKINGRAEHYLAYDVISLTYIGFMDGAEGSRFLNVFVYNMGTPNRAFGVFSLESLQDQPAVELGRKGYRVENNYFFWKGAYYVQIIASERGEDLRRIGMEVARTLVERIEDSGEPIWGLTAFPEVNRVPGTVQYFMRDALSLDFLKDTYTAQYRKGGAEVTAFLSRQDSPEAAAKTLTHYLDYLKGYGEIVGRRETAGVTLVIGGISGTFDVVFRQERLIGGVTMVEDRTLAEQMATELSGHLSKR